MASEYKDRDVALPVRWPWQPRSERGQRSVTAEHLGGSRALSQPLSAEAPLPQAVCQGLELCVKDTAPSNTLPARLDGWRLPFGGVLAADLDLGGEGRGKEGGLRDLCLMQTLSSLHEQATLLQRGWMACPPPGQQRVRGEYVLRTDTQKGCNYFCPCSLSTLFIRQSKNQV